MAYDEYTAERLREVLRKRKVAFRELNMMGGLCFMVDEKMCCGLLTNKADGEPLFMARIGEQACATIVDEPFTKPMDFTGRPMKGYVFVEAEGIDAEADLEKWIERCLAYNPLAKASKKRKS